MGNRFGYGWGLALVLSAAACGGGEGGPDARLTGFDAPNRTDRYYVVQRFILPTTLEEVNDGKFEFPGSGLPVNKMGALIQVQMDLLEGLPVQAEMDAAFAAGEARQLLGVRSGPLELTDGGANGLYARVVDADDPVDPSNDYSGTAQFRLAPGEMVGNTWSGSVSAGTVLGNGDIYADNAYAWALPLIAGEEPVLAIGRHGLSRATVTEDTMVGWGASGITRAEVDALVLPPTAALLTRGIAENVARKNDIKNLFDTNNDDIVTPAELIASPTMATLLQPDMDLDGDGTNDHISQSLAFEAVRAELVP